MGILGILGSIKEQILKAEKIKEKCQNPEEKKMLEAVIELAKQYLFSLGYESIEDE